MKHFHNWKLGTINVRTAREDEKLEKVFKEIRKANLSICGLQEVRRKNGLALIELNELNEKYEVYWSGYATKRIHGVGIAIKVDLNCYAPTEESTTPCKDIFYASLRKQLNTDNNRKIICIGDFNATTSASWYNSSLRERMIVNDLIANNNGERFHELFNTQKLSVMNTWFTHKECRRVTWHSPDGVTKKSYDFILCCSWIRQFITNCRVYNSYDFDSDHRLVIASLTTPCTKIKILHKFKNAATESLDTIDLQSDNTALNNNLLKSINEAASENIPTIRNTKLYQPWHNDDKLRELYELKNRLMIRNSDQKAIKAARKKIRLRCRHLKNKYLEQEAEKLSQLAVNRNLERLFHRAKEQGTTLKAIPSSCQPQKLLEHFKSHFNPVDPSELVEPSELSTDLPTFIRELQEISGKTPIEDNPPSIDEIRKHIKLLKNKKANNDIDTELIKLCDEPAAHRILHQITLNVWNNLDIPESWGNTRLKTLWKKKGSKNDPSKYRGLSIGSTICKLLVNIILERLRPWYDAQLTDEQNGFRQNRGTTDGIFILKQIQQITDRKKQPLFLLNTVIKNVENFIYLGTYIRFDQPNTGDPEINHRIQLAISKFTDMGNLLQNMRINLKTRIKFLNSFVRSTLTCACQNWNTNTNQIDRLDATYRGFLRRMVRGGYRYCITNEELHNLCGTSDLSTFIRKQQQNYVQHVIRMPVYRSVKLLAFNCDKYTKRGRSCKTLLDQVVDSSGLSLDELCNRALARK
ncbi:uncharacterized protein [Clytia hemisphaerica]|uniref:uncharacterized protein n=1 Tax=Clytia hemisphaerica TaxID=252671 RepID=UPI0034D3EDEA